MRTTLTLDPDVALLLEKEVHRQRRPFKQIVNDALRRALGGRTARRAEPYHVVPHQARLRPGLDRLALNRLADELEDEAVLTKGRR
jgi:hypothetical protein